MYLYNAKCTIECTFFFAKHTSMFIYFTKCTIIRRLGDNVLANMRRVTSVIPRQEAFIVSQKTCTFAIPHWVKRQRIICVGI